MSTTKQLLLVEEKLPEESIAALITFVGANPHINGAGWAEGLEMLHDADANLDVTEPMWDALAEDMDEGVRWTIPLVTLTLLYALRRPPTEDEVYQGIVAVLV